jgi:hypothetical protein
MIDEISNEIGGNKIEIKIKALDKGSFLIHVGLNPAEIYQIVSSINWDAVYRVIGSLVGVLTLRKLLKREKPEKIEEKGNNVKITTKSGNVVNVDKLTFNIYNNNVKVNEAISENFEALKADSSIEGFEITDVKDKPIFEIPKKEFEEMAVKSQNEIDENKKIIILPATLNIFKLVWDNKRKWEFYWRGNKISAKIVDETFFENIDKGEQFAKGDSLEVELQITQIFDKSVNTFINDINSYQIVKVIRHVPRPTQEKLGL